MSERNVLLKNVKHSFLVGLHYSFQTADKLYFVLDYINGGEVCDFKLCCLSDSFFGVPLTQRVDHGLAMLRLWVWFLGNSQTDWIKINTTLHSNNKISREKNILQERQERVIKNSIVKYVGDSEVDADSIRISCHEKQRGATRLRKGNSPQEMLGGESLWRESQI